MGYTVADESLVSLVYWIAGQQFEPLDEPESWIGDASTHAWRLRGTR